MSVNTIDIVVREIPAEVSTLFAELSDEERSRASQLAANRCREWVAWRAVLREQAERWRLNDCALRVAYAPSGEPLFEGLEGSISVTHSRKVVAVARAWQGRCGIDIEQLDRNFERIEDKYISTAERVIASADDPRFRAAVWCAKEAMFKCMGRTGVDFRRDLLITEVDFASGCVRGTAFGERLEGVIQLLEGAILVAVTTTPNSQFEIRQ